MFLFLVGGAVECISCVKCVLEGRFKNYKWKQIMQIVQPLFVLGEWCQGGIVALSETNI